MAPRNSAIASDLPILLLHAAGANLQGKMDRDGDSAAKLLSKYRELRSTSRVIGHCFERFLSEFMPKWAYKWVTGTSSLLRHWTAYFVRHYFLAESICPPYSEGSGDVDAVATLPLYCVHIPQIVTFNLDSFSGARSYPLCRPVPIQYPASAALRHAQLLPDMPAAHYDVRQQARTDAGLRGHRLNIRDCLHFKDTTVASPTLLYRSGMQVKITI